MTDKLSLTNLVSLQNETSAINAINNNNAAIITAMDNTLSRDGTSPNTMSANLDMNSHRILNLPTPSTLTEAARLQDVTGTVNLTLSNYQLTGDVTTSLGSGVQAATIAANAVTNAKMATMPTMTIKGNITGGAAAPTDLTLANFMNTYLRSGNNTAPGVRLYNIDSSSTSTLNTILSSFQAYMIVAGSQKGTFGGSAIFGACIQDRNDVPTQPCGITGYSIINSGGAGSSSWGVFGRSDLAVAGAICGAEFNCNMSIDAPNEFPPNLASAFPLVNSYGIGVQSVNIGVKRGNIAFRAVTSAQFGINSPWLASFYADPPVPGSLYGLFIDASSTLGQVTPALIRSPGNLGTTFPHLLLQTMGTAAVASPVIAHQNIAGPFTFQVMQGGMIVSNANAVATTPPTNTNLWAIGLDSQKTAIQLDNYNGGAVTGVNTIINRQARGTGASPAVLSAGDVIASWIGQPWTSVGPGFAGTTARHAIIYTDSDTSKNGTALTFDTTPNGSLTRAEAVRIQPSGGLSVGTTTDGGIGSLVLNKSITIQNATAVPAGGTADVGLLMSSTAHLGLFFGSGAPTLSAAQGSVYIRTDGSSTATRLYINTNGSTGWTNVTTAA